MGEERVFLKIASSFIYAYTTKNTGPGGLVSKICMTCGYPNDPFTEMHTSSP